MDIRQKLREIVRRNSSSSTAPYFFLAAGFFCATFLLEVF